MSEREIVPGQVWTFWAYDGEIKVVLTLDRVDETYAHGHDEDGYPCVVGLARLRDRGTLLDSPA